MGAPSGVVGLKRRAQPGPLRGGIGVGMAKAVPVEPS